MDIYTLQTRANTAAVASRVPLFDDSTEARFHSVSLPQHPGWDAVELNLPDCRSNLERLQNPIKILQVPVLQKKVC